MNTNELNLNYLNVFRVVYQLQSMTLAAEKLHLTQSGVSQHINHLEVALDTVLFERVGRQIVPTHLADSLYESCSEAFTILDSALESITSKERPVSGEVRLGLPIEFGNTFILPLLAPLARQYPLVKFQIFYGHALSLKEELLENRMDLALVDDFPMGLKIEKVPIYNEELHLCGSANYLALLDQNIVKKLNKTASLTRSEIKEVIESLDFVDYQKTEPILQQWLQFHYGNKSKFKLNMRAWAMDVQGLKQLITSGMGLGILPHHMVGGDLQTLKGNGKILKNQISLATIKGRILSPATLIVKKYIAQQTIG